MAATTMRDSVAMKPYVGPAIKAILDDLAGLRIRVFREWPYLYDGSIDYETRYLAHFAEAPGAIVVGAVAGDRMIGAATAAPMVEHADAFATPFRRAGYDVERIFYCGESVLLKDYRGLGIGHSFFDERETHARALGGFTHSAFCRVQRPDDHPLKPADYAPLDPFWMKRGYRPAEGLVADYAWKDIDQPGETDHAMQFWLRPL